MFRSDWRWRVTGGLARALWWLARQPFELLWLIFRLLTAGLLRAAHVAPRGTPRARVRQAERRVAVLVLIPATAGSWLGVTQLAGRASYHDLHAILASLGLALALVALAAIVAWKLWSASPAGLRWRLTRELENPRRRGYRLPRASVKGVRLP